MAREFAKSEIIRQKCSICGIKNKRFIELLYDGKMCGYRLACCKCGHVDTFFKDENFSEFSKITTGREVCIQVTTCNHRTCQYYGKYSLKYAARLIDRILNGINADCICDNMDCINCEFSDTCPNKQNNDSCDDKNPSIEFLNSYQLDINGYEINKPKFH